MNNLVILVIKPVYSLFLDYGVCRCLMMKEWFGCLSLSDTFLSQFFGFFLSEFDLWGVNVPHFCVVCFFCTFFL